MAGVGQNGSNWPPIGSRQHVVRSPQKLAQILSRVWWLQKNEKKISPTPHMVGVAQNGSNWPPVGLRQPQKLVQVYTLYLHKNAIILLHILIVWSRDEPPKEKRSTPNAAQFISFLFDLFLLLWTAELISDTKFLHITLKNFTTSLSNITLKAWFLMQDVSRIPP